jgi:hypothetical protein
LARDGQAVRALRLAARAGVVDMENEDDDHNRASGNGGAERAHNAAAGLSNSPATAAEKDDLIRRLLPTDRGRATEPHLRPYKNADPLPRRAITRVKWAKLMRQLDPKRSPGPDGLRPEHVIGMMTAPLGAGKEFVAAWAALAEAIVTGEVVVPSESRLMAARVTFIPKTDGGLRPLGVVGVWRRLLCRGVAQMLVPRAQLWLLRRGQLGVGAAAGTEAMARLLQLAYEPERGLAGLVIDRSNAYSTVRPEVAEALWARLVPEMRTLGAALLGEVRVYGGSEVYLWRGLFMGCPLSPFIFAGVVEVGLDEIREQLRDMQVLSIGFLDDGGLLGPPEGLAGALALVEEAGGGAGLRLNRAKSMLLMAAKLADEMAGDDESLAADGGEATGTARASAVFKRLGIAGVTRIATEGAIVVGVPVGTDDYRRRTTEKIVRDAAVLRRAVAARLTPQGALFLARAADAWPKVLHAFRATPARLTEGAAAAHDESVRGTLAIAAGMARQDLDALPLSEAVHWPFRLGGRALASAKALAGVAHSAAAVQSARAIDLVTRAVGWGVTRASGEELQSMVSTHLARPSGRPCNGGSGVHPGGGGANEGAGSGGGTLLCSGAARCRMPWHVKCARRRCQCCCVLSRDACGACTAAAQLLVEARGVGFEPEVRESLDVVAREIGADAAKVRRAFAVAAAFVAPQRALSCAVVGWQCAETRARLARERRSFELNVLDAQSDAGAYSKWLVAPIGRMAMTHDEVLVDLRMALGATVLAPTSMRCAARAERGEKALTCPQARGGILRLKHASAEGEGGTAAARVADTHARVCKRGGGVTATHNRVVEAIAVTLRSWGVAVALEAHDFLTGSKRIDLLVRGATPDAALVAVDVTRRDNASVATLHAGERDKVAKYSPIYGERAVVYGFAFDQYGRLGPQAHSAVALFVRCGTLACGAPADLLRREMYAAVGIAVARGTTAQYAAVGAANRDRSLGVPLLYNAHGGLHGQLGVSIQCELARVSGLAGLHGGAV